MPLHVNLTLAIVQEKEYFQANKCFEKLYIVFCCERKKLLTLFSDHLFHLRQLAPT